MYLRVIQARTHDEGGTRKQWEAWHREVAPRLTGWLGGAAGVTDQGEVAALLMFEDEDAARRGDELLARSTEWRDFAGSLGVPRLAHDLPEARMFGSGRPGAAGLVRIERGKVAEPEALAAVAEKMEPYLEEQCPDVLCYAFGRQGDHFARALFVTSRADEEANEDWRPARLRRLADRWDTLVDEVERLELTEPWHLWASVDAAPIEDDRPGPRSQAEPRLVAALEDLVSSAKVLEGVAVVGPGSRIVSALPPGVSRDRVAALSASLVSLGEMARDEIARGDLKHALLEGDAGYLIAATAGPGRTLVALAPSNARLGDLLYEVQRAAGNIALIGESTPRERGAPV